MEESIVLVHYIIDNEMIEVPTKMVYIQSDENEIVNIHYEVVFENTSIVSVESSSSEYAIVNLNKALPSNINIACCQSCRHGNFCTYGDNENEIFCFKDMKLNNKGEVCEWFSKSLNFLDTRKRKFLDYCSSFKPISHDEYYTYNSYTYNSWGL